MSRRNIVIHSPDQSQVCPLRRDCIGPVPDWVPKTAYFKALVADGKLVLPKKQDAKKQDASK